MKRYIAYGSNINSNWMNGLCNQAKCLGKGYILNARVVYRGKGYLNLELGVGFGKVPVLIWGIDDNCEKKLDQYEQFPVYYEKRQILVETDNGVVQGMVYLMTEQYENIKCEPEEYYVKRVKDGYQQVNFPIELLDEAMDEVRNNGLSN